MRSFFIALSFLGFINVQAQTLSEKIQSQVSDTSVGVCHVRLIRADLTLARFTGPVLVKEACYLFGKSMLEASEIEVKEVIVKHNGRYKTFER